MSSAREISVRVPVLARVEGEGALELDVCDGRLAGVRLRIYEPPRFFEKFLEGRHFSEVPDIVARICGICPVAYQMSAVQALESILGVDPGPWVRAMRRLMYCGEWIESHALHIHLLAAPDFLGFDSAIAMTGRFPDEVRRGLRLQGLGNRIIRFLGGRSVHPVGVRVGGFPRAQDSADARDLRTALAAALPDAAELVRWTASLPLPDDAQDFESVALATSGAYAIESGALRSDRGLDLAIADFDTVFAESHVPHSTALHCLHDGQPYLVGPLARINLNLDSLDPATRQLAEATGIRWPSRNMFHSVVARALEIHYALGEAVRLLDASEPPRQTLVEAAARAGVGAGCTEAPRGILWHRYQLDGAGRITAARIVPPTSQNQARVEQDLAASLTRFGLERPESELRLHAETVIRNYDPCISCATHFLDLTVTRG